MSFANLKRQSSNLDKLSKAIESLNSSSDFGNNDDQYWKCEVDKAGNGMATIRFLPAPEKDGDEGLPFVKLFSHGFKDNGGWFIDNCPTTNGDTCPVCESNSALWNSGIKANRDIVSGTRDNPGRKRKLSYISNIYVVSDPKHPENEGKVFLFKYGKKIFDKLTEAMHPAFEDETAINPFNLWEGANFKLKIRRVEGYQNYDKSEFESAAPLASDEEMEKIWNSEYSLKELVAPTQFKSYDKLKERLDKVLGQGEAPKKTTVETLRETAPKTVADDAPWNDTSTNEEDDDLAYFANLVDAE